MIKAVIFDWDLTLAKTFRFRARLFRHFCSLAGISFLRVSRHVRRLFGMTVVDILAMAPSWVSRTQALALYKASFKRDAWMMEFVGKPLLLELQKDYKIGIVTNDLKENISWYLKKQRVPIKVVLDTNERPKPNPAALKDALKRLRVKPSEAVYVGDHPFDVRFGKNAGVKTIAVATWLHGRRRLAKENPDAIGRLRDVADILRSRRLDA